MKHLAISRILLLLAIITLASACKQPNTQIQNREIEPPFCHHVYFWLHNPDSPADRAAFEKGIHALLEIPEIKAYHIGTPATTEVRGVVDASYTYSYAIFFNDNESHDIYQDHPLHHKFVEDCQHLWSKVVVYDSVRLQ